MGHEFREYEGALESWLFGGADFLVALCDYLLDPFGGSGSTLIACEQTDRICKTMELDPKYATVIVERFHLDYPDQEITVLRDGKTFTYTEIAQTLAET